MTGQLPAQNLAPEPESASEESASEESASAEIARLFDRALAAPPAARGAFLERACSDPAIRREVESLLAADAEAGGFLEPLLAVERAGDPVRDPGDRIDDHVPGTRIGPYRLVDKLGEGEASSVYLAVRDDDQYRQCVAIKLIRPGMDSRQILQRFHQERQILASLNHPHIARLLDGGSTPAGQPYFVMEHVDGQPLDVHCEAARLSRARRLELFGQICHAVHYAHQNLVVHRDLKPGNILIAADGTPKLLDFGIAKLLDPERAGIRIEPTAAVARLMTPHYASPEQVQGKPVNTASDVYSLGVILYKLLTGQRPYELGSLSLHAIERVVCESTPPPPSAVLRARRERLPRDLDNIVGMAMRKQPERRYASAQELADDVRRCLEHRPVLARRDTLGYRVASFVRRNAGAVAATMVVMVSLLAGAVATTWQWRRAVAERTRAETQRMTAEQTRNFVVELFKVPGSHIAASDVTARELLETGAARLRESQQPREIRAALTHTLGVVYRNLGDYRHAAPLLDEAVAARSAIPGGELELADSLFELGSVASDNGDYRRGEILLRRALAIRVQRLGPHDLAVADVLEQLAYNVEYNIPLHEAIDDFRRVLEIRRRHLPPGDPRVVSSIAGLAAMYSLAGYHDNADELLAEGMAIRGRVAAGAPCRAGDVPLLRELAVLRTREGQLAEADRHAAAAVDCALRQLGPSHVVVVDTRAVQIPIWTEQGRYAEAEPLARDSLARRRLLHGEATPAVDSALHQLAHVLFERGELIEAAELEATALARREAAYGKVHAAVAESLQGLADIRLAQGDAQDAEAAYRDALHIWRHELGDDHPSAGEAMRGVAEALAAEGKRLEAEAFAGRALALQRQRLRAGHPAIATTLVVLGQIAQASSPAAAEPSLREAVASRKVALGIDHPATARAESQLGACLALQHKTAEALVVLRHATAALRARLGDDHPATQLAERRLLAAGSPTPSPE